MRPFLLMNSGMFQRPQVEPPEYSEGQQYEETTPEEVKKNWAYLMNIEFLDFNSSNIFCETHLLTAISAFIAR